MPKININKVNKTRYNAHIKATTDEKEQCDKKAFEDIRLNVKVDGFRKGKVPEHIIKNRYADELKNKSFQNIINLASEQLIKDAQKGIYKIIKVENVSSDKGGYTFDLIFDSFPVIQLGKMKGITIKENIPIIEESDMQKEILEIQRLFAEKKIRHEDESGIVGDLVIVSYEQWSDGAPVGENAKDVQFFLGDMLFDKEIEEQLISTNIKQGQEHRFSKKVPQKDGVEKTVDIIMQIEAIYQMIYPELSDELASKYDPDYTSVKDLKNDINKVLTSRFHRKNMDEEIGGVLIQLHETAEVDFPENYIDEKMKKYLQEELKVDLQSIPEKELNEFSKAFETSQKKNLVNEHILGEAMGVINRETYQSGFVNFIEENFDKRMARTFKIIYANAIQHKNQSDHDAFIERLLKSYHLDMLEKYFREKGLIKKDKKIKYLEFMSEKKKDTAGVK